MVGRFATATDSAPSFLKPATLHFGIIRNNRNVFALTQIGDRILTSQHFSRMNCRLLQSHLAPRRLRLLWHGAVTSKSISALIVAALDLNLVRLLRQAMRVADLTVASERPISQMATTPGQDRRCCPCPQNAAAPSAPLIPAVDRYEPSNTIIVSLPPRQFTGSGGSAASANRCSAGAQLA